MQIRDNFPQLFCLVLKEENRTETFLNAKCNIYFHQNFIRLKWLLAQSDIKKSVELKIVAKFRF